MIYKKIFVACEERQDAIYYELLDEKNIGYAAYSAYSDYRSSPERKKILNLYVFSTVGREPTTDEERRLLKEEEEVGMSIKVGDYYIPDEYADDYVDVVRDGEQVYVSYDTIGADDYDWEWGWVIIPCTVGGKRYRIFATVGIDKEGTLFRVHSSDEYSNNYVTTVEDEDGNDYVLYRDEVPGVSFYVFASILEDVIPDEMWSSDDVNDVNKF